MVALLWMNVSAVLKQRRERETHTLRIQRGTNCWEWEIRWKRQKEREGEKERKTGSEEKGFEIETERELRESSLTNVPFHSFLNKICKAASTSEVLIFLKHSEEGRKTKTNSSLLLIEELSSSCYLSYNDARESFLFTLITLLTAHLNWMGAYFYLCILAS